ncbi:MAG: hypothetical protein FWH28_06425 [Clostridiales bacterium]|nr:hypothetical protein [Clostridiales bacterium]
MDIKNIRTLAQQCEIPLTTFYRYLRGEVAMPRSAEEAISSALRLSETEEQEFYAILRRYIKHKPMSKLFQVMDSLVFGGDGLPEGADAGGDVLYFNQDRHLIPITKLFEQMLANVKAPNFRCSLKIIHGIGMPHFFWLADFIDELIQRAPKASIEHLVSLPEKDHAGSLQTLLTVLPLLKHGNYSLFYTADDLPEQTKQSLGRMIYFSTAFDSENGLFGTDNYLISIRETGRIECLHIGNPLFHEFLTNHYFDLRQFYPKDFSAIRYLNQSLDFYADKSRERPVCTLQSDLPFSCISEDAYNSILARSEGEERLAAEALASAASVYRQASYSHPITDICSKNGLLTMVKTGLLTNPATGLPQLNKAELRMSLEYVRDRNCDTHNAYSLFITDKQILKGRHATVVYRDEGASFSFDDAKRGGAPMIDNNFYIENKSLGNLLYEYMTDYIPLNHALSQTDTTAFLNSLINLYL